MNRSRPLVSAATQALDDDPDAGPFWQLVDHVALMRGLGERDLNLVGRDPRGGGATRHSARSRRA